MKIKRNIKFSLYSRNAETENVPIRMRLTWNGNRLDIYTPYSVDFKNWDSSSGRVIPKTVNRKNEAAGEVNAGLSEFESTVTSVFARFELSQTIPTVLQFRNAFDEFSNKEHSDKRLLFLDLWDEFVQVMSVQNSWAVQTQKNMKTVRGHVEKYNPHLNVSTLEEGDLLGLVKYFIKNGSRNSSILKNIEYIKWFLRWANRKGCYNGRLHEDFAPKLKEVSAKSKDVIHLTWDELTRLYSLEIPDDKRYLSAVRDVFCFCCFTGLRYSDVLTLKKTDVRDGCIHVVTQKTADTLSIDLNKYSTAILDKYRDTELSDNRALPVISNQKMNSYLKKLGEFAELDEIQTLVYFKGNYRQEDSYKKWELLTTHCGRRTFIVNALYLGIPAEVVMKWTGHSCYEAMKPYVKIVDDLKKKEMNKFNI